MRYAWLLIPPLCCVLATGCSSERADQLADSSQEVESQAAPKASSETPLVRARQSFDTTITRQGDDFGPPDQPPQGVYDLVRYDSPVGPLAAYVTPDPGDGKKRPAILWITGGDNNSIGDVWTAQPRDNDQSVPAFRAAGIVTMFPSQRGGNDNPGRREGFFGEVDDVIAAADYVANLSYVDPSQIYLGGHSTGATLAMLVGQCTDRFRAVFSLGPVASPSQYGGDFTYYDIEDEKENDLRSPYRWLDSAKSPMYVIEGVDGNWTGACKVMADINTNPAVRILSVEGHNHFTVISPVTELLAQQIMARRIDITPAKLMNLR
ncbi:MAG: prolyl oligopeptidase family serine peptidase [Planctomycetota bacterium]